MCSLYYPPLVSLLSSMAFSNVPASSDWFCVRGFLHIISPPSHEQNIVHPSLEQLQGAVLHPDVMQLQWISRSMSGGADSVSCGTVRGSGIPWLSTSQPYLVGSIAGGDSRSAAFHVVTSRWHLWTFFINAAVVGRKKYRFTNDAPLFPVLERHTFTLHSIIDVQYFVDLPYAAHMNVAAWASTYFISAARWHEHWGVASFKLTIVKLNKKHICVITHDIDWLAQES